MRTMSGQILGQIQPFLAKSNGQNKFSYKKARSTLDAVGMLAHSIAKSLNVLRDLDIVRIIIIASYFYLLCALLIFAKTNNA